MNLLDLYADVQSALGAAATQSFENSFLRALYKVVHDLNLKLGESIVSPSQIISQDIGFEDYCDNVYFPGIKFYLQRGGGWAQDPDTESVQFYERELRKVIGHKMYADDTFATRNEA